MRWLVWGTLGCLAAGCMVDPGTDERGAAAGEAPGGGKADSASDDRRCRPRLPGPDNRDRKLVISLPYNEDSSHSGRFRVLELTEAGDIVETGVEFEMQRTTSGVIAFTPDGNIGIAVQDQGTLGVFAIEDDGSVRVVQDGYNGNGEFYAGSVVVDPDGHRAYVIDRNWRENGGGVYSLRIGCDGSLRSDGKLFDAKLSAGMVFLSDQRAVLAAADAISSPKDQHVHLIDWADRPAWMSGTNAFGDTSAITSWMTVTHDEQFVLLGDYSAFSGVPNRIAVARLRNGILKPAQVVTPVEDPFALAMSPFDRSGIVVSGYGDAIFRLVYGDDDDAPYSIEPLEYDGRRPQLPSALVTVDRGDLTGRVLVVENTAVRQVEFREEIGAVDLGPTSTGQGVGAIVGAIGIQP